MNFIIKVIMLLLFFLFGFIIGKREGYKKGYRLGNSYSPIEIRIKMLKTGVCPICQNNYATTED